MSTENKFTNRMKGAMEGDEEKQPLIEGDEQIYNAKINPSDNINGTFLEKP